MHSSLPEALPSRVAITGALRDGFAEILSDKAIAFLSDLHTNFRGRIFELLTMRARRRADWAAGRQLDFLPETTAVREAEWKIAPIPEDLEKRVVEITGPVDRKMVINALNSGADTFMADFEDSSSPTWENMIQGQVNLKDAVSGVISFTDRVRDKHYGLSEETAALFVRPRGLHLQEGHFLVDGEPIPAALFDFGLYLFHNAQALLKNGSGPYFYLPKLESHHEARLWNDVFRHAQDFLGLNEGTIKATVLIETLPAAFEMDEILFELREHSAGLNCGRWDYIFSFIKTRRWDTGALLPDRSQITMDQPFMRAYTQLAVKTCHRRWAHAIGGMAAQIPIKDDSEANAKALSRVRADKLREVRDGHDGTWVAHPGLVPIAREVFESQMVTKNQIHRFRDDIHVRAEDLLEVPTGTRTEDGLRLNIRVGIQYLAAWLCGNGCVPLYNLMEDAATAEISRTQIWQWVHHATSLLNGTVVTPELVRHMADQETQAIEQQLGATRFAQGRYAMARELFLGLCSSTQLEEFLTTTAYPELSSPGSSR